MNLRVTLDQNVMAYGAQLEVEKAH